MDKEGWRTYSNATSSLYIPLVSQPYRQRIARRELGHYFGAIGLPLSLLFYPSLSDFLVIDMPETSKSQTLLSPLHFRCLPNYQMHYQVYQQPSTKPVPAQLLPSQTFPPTTRARRACAGIKRG